MGLKVIITGLFGAEPVGRAENAVGLLIALGFSGVCFLFAAFGFFVLWRMALEIRKLTVSRREIDIHPWIGRTRTIDVSSLAHLVMYGEEPDLVFLPRVGPPLLTLAAKDFSKDMPAAIADHVGVQLERFGNIDKGELATKYPKNAVQTARMYELENEWRNRKWQW